MKGTVHAVTPSLVQARRCRVLSLWWFPRGSLSGTLFSLVGKPRDRVLNLGLPKPPTFISEKARDNVADLA